MEWIKKRIEEEFNSLSTEKKAKYLKEEKHGKKIYCYIFGLAYIFLGIGGLIATLLGMQIEPDSYSSWGIMLFLSAVVIIVGLIFIVWLLIFLKKPDDEIVKNKIKNIIKKDKSGNLEYEIQNEIARQKGDFKVSRIITLKSSFLEKDYLIMDNEKRLIVFKFNYNYTKIYTYKDLIGYEIYENESSVVQGTAGRSLVGGIFFGLEGAVIGGNSGRKIGNYCQKLELIIRLNDIDLPQIKFSYVNAQIEKSSFTYSTLKNQLQGICSILEFIINNKKLEESAQGTVQTKIEQKTSKEQLVELKEMLDDGLITQEEFDQKKKQILGL